MDPCLIWLVLRVADWSKNIMWFNQLQSGLQIHSITHTDMTTAEILTIGTEILLGEIVDTNTRHLSRKLREQGIDLIRQTAVGDKGNHIA